MYGTLPDMEGNTMTGSQAFSEMCRIWSDAVRLAAGFIRFTTASMVVALLLCGCAGVPVHDTVARQSNLFNEERLRLTADYVRHHYGIVGYELREPQVIVLHYNGISLAD